MPLFYSYIKPVRMIHKCWVEINMGYLAEWFLNIQCNWFLDIVVFCMLFFFLYAFLMNSQKGGIELIP